MTWIRTIPLADADEALRRAIEAQRALYPVEDETPVHPTGDVTAATVGLSPPATARHRRGRNAIRRQCLLVTLLTAFVALSIASCSGNRYATGTVPGVIVTILPGLVTLTVGQSASFTATVAGSPVSSVVWRSESPGVATVDNTGIVTSVAPGTTLITARAVADTLRTGSATVNVIAREWSLVWSDEFTGEANTAIDVAKWRFDLGTSYPGGAPNWGTGEIETMTSDLENVSLDGAGHLRIAPVRSESGRWTSGRIETQRNDFEPRGNGLLAVEASIQQPNVNATNGLGYWPAFWMLGGPFRGNYTNWPSVGEIDILESINGRSTLFSTFHCGPGIPGTCNEPTGRGSGERPCAGCLGSFHTYRVEWDRSVSPQLLRWYLDGSVYFTLSQSQVDAQSWATATNHGYLIILNVAVGGGFPAAFGGGPTFATVSGVPMLVDFVRVYQR